LLLKQDRVSLCLLSSVLTLHQLSKSFSFHSWHMNKERLYPHAALPCNVPLFSTMERYSLKASNDTLLGRFLPLTSPRVIKPTFTRLIHVFSTIPYAFERRPCTFVLQQPNLVALLSRNVSGWHGGCSLISLYLD
jgi:hypothetical protein